MWTAVAVHNRASRVALDVGARAERRPVLPSLAAWTREVVGRPCAGCRGPGGPWCDACASLLDGPSRPAVLTPRPPGLPAVHAVSAYAGPVREGLVAFKDHGRWHLRSVLGTALARSVAGLLLDVAPTDARPVVLVPAPGSPGSARRRDGDHVRELARVAARVVRTTGRRASVVPALGPVRRRDDQVGLGRRARAANLAGSIEATAAARSLAGAAVVVVDDLVTSGATLAECVRALRAAGVEPLGAATVASVVVGRGRTPRRPW